MRSSRRVDDGRFSIRNSGVGDFGGFAAVPNVKALRGDFNGAPRIDVALVGGSGWTSIPVAFSKTDGSFTVTNLHVGDFGLWAATANVTPLVGDYDGDGRTDIALTGGVGWNTLPMARSLGNGTFSVTNHPEQDLT